MKANNTAQRLSQGINAKNEATSPFGHTLTSMGGIIDTAMTSGKAVGLHSMLITLNSVQGDITAKRRLPQNTDDATMTAMKIRPHLRWLAGEGGLKRAIKVFGVKQGRYRHGVAAHMANALLVEIKGLQGIVAG